MNQSYIHIVYEKQRKLVNIHLLKRPAYGSAENNEQRQRRRLQYPVFQSVDKARLSYPMRL